MSFTSASRFIVDPSRSEPAPGPTTAEAAATTAEAAAAAESTAPSMPAAAHREEQHEEQAGVADREIAEAEQRDDAEHDLERPGRGGRRTRRPDRACAGERDLVV